MSRLFFDYKADPVLGKEFETRWKQVSEKQSSDKSYTSDELEALGSLKDFLQKYYLDFSSKASANPNPGTSQEKEHIKRIAKSLEFYSTWLIRITREMKDWSPPRWSANREILQELSDSKVIIKAQGKVRTYKRIPDNPKEESPERLSAFDEIFIELRRLLHNLATDIMDAKSNIK